MFAAAVIWGFAFVAQSEGMNHLGPYSFTGARYLMGAAVLFPLVLVRRRTAGIMFQSRENITGGLWCGLVLCVATLFQQVGIMYTTVGKAGFITTLYIIIVPVLGLFLKRKVPGVVWYGAAISAFGIYLLCVNEYFSINMTDGYLFASAFLFSVHIMVIDHFSGKTDGIALSLIQFLIAGTISFAIGLVTEHPQLGDFLGGFLPLGYAGILSTGVAYTLQVVGQRDTDPAVAALILSMESVFSVLAGWLILGQWLNSRELAGCGLVFLAVILVQLPFKKKGIRRLPTE